MKISPSPLSGSSDFLISLRKVGSELSQMTPSLLCLLPPYLGFFRSSFLEKAGKLHKYIPSM